MGRLFNVTMRIVNMLLGLLMVCLGFVLVLQGLSIGFKAGGPMVGDRQWVLWGGLLALIGIAEVIWSNNRQA
jgi:hypothetical protein